MKILIVDDEKLARDTLVAMVREFSERISFDVEIREAKDGEEALNGIRADQPDIVIADILMPNLNGIELLKRINDLELSPLFIFVSGFDSFEYAQKAVSLGAFSYLLKPVRQSELEETLTKAHFRLLKEHNRMTNNLNRDLLFRKNLKTLQKSFMTKLVMAEYANPDDVEPTVDHQLQELNILFDYNGYVVMLVHLHFIDGDVERASADNELDLLIKEIFAKRRIGCNAFEADNKLAYVLNYAPSGSTMEILTECGHELTAALNRSFRCNVSIGIGLLTNQLGLLNTSYRNACNALFQIGFKSPSTDAEVSPNSLVFCETDSSDETIVDKEIHQYADHLAKLLESSGSGGNKAGAMELIGKYYRLFFNSRLGFSHDIVSKLNFHTIMVLTAFLEKAGLNPEETLGNEFFLYNKLNACSTSEAVLLWCEEKITSVFDATQSVYENNHVKMVNRVKEFVHANIDNNISLTMAANHVFVTPQYLSKIFHQVEGDNFVNFVKRAKIDRAKQLLKQGYKPNEVSETLGFSDQKYFFKVFKQATGFSPSSYKKI